MPWLGVDIHIDFVTEVLGQFTVRLYVIYLLLKTPRNIDIFSGIAYLDTQTASIDNASRETGPPGFWRAAGRLVPER